MTTRIARRALLARRIVQDGTLDRVAERTPDEFEIVRAESYAVIAVARELDLSNVKALEKAIQRTAVGFEGLVVDLRACPACDSSSLAMMAKHRYLRKDRVRFVVAATGFVRKIFEITGLSRNMVLYPTLDAALAGLRTTVAAEAS